jgi:hypothetical protein
MGSGSRLASFILGWMVTAVMLANVLAQIGRRSGDRFQ